MAETLHIVCPNCSAVNRVRQDKLSLGPKCGRCKAALFSGRPVELTGASYQTHVRKNDLPLLVDCWAPWCGPCKMMGPAFAEAAKQLEPHVRLAKIDTEAEPQLGAQLGIRSIPTLVLFRGGREVARQSGALNSTQIITWVKDRLGR